MISLFFGTITKDAVMLVFRRCGCTTAPYELRCKRRRVDFVLSAALPSGFSSLSHVYILVLERMRWQLDGRDSGDGAQRGNAGRAEAGGIARDVDVREMLCVG